MCSGKKQTSKKRKTTEDPLTLCCALALQANSFFPSSRPAPVGLTNNEEGRNGFQRQTEMWEMIPHWLELQLVSVSHLLCTCVSGLAIALCLRSMRNKNKEIRFVDIVGIKITKSLELSTKQVVLLAFSA